MGWKLIFNCVCNISFTLAVRGWEKLIECNDKFFSFLAPCTPCNHLDVSCTNVYLGIRESRHGHIANRALKLIDMGSSITCEIVLCTKNRFCHENPFFCVRVDASTIFFNYCCSICSIYSLDIVPWRNLCCGNFPFRKIYLDTCCNF